jgi:DNA-binding CsgD family transcriptional regulator
MAIRKRRRYTESEKSEMWDRWRKGESMNEIGRLFGIQGHSSIQTIFSETGGIRPAGRRRSARSLSLSEREEISRGLVAGRSLRWIAADLGRAPSTISREIRRNRGPAMLPSP